MSTCVCGHFCVCLPQFATPFVSSQLLSGAYYQDDVVSFSVFLLLSQQPSSSFLPMIGNTGESAASFAAACSQSLISWRKTSRPSVRPPLSLSLLSASPNVPLAFGKKVLRSCFTEEPDSEAFFSFFFISFTWIFTIFREPVIRLVCSVCILLI